MGGKIVMPVTEVPGMVTYAMFSDPEGNMVGIVKDVPPPPKAQAARRRSAGGRAAGRKAPARRKSAKRKSGRR
jgi:hypothetical protein